MISRRYIFGTAAGLILTVYLGVSVVDLFARPWRSRQLDSLITRATRAVCFEQPEAAERLLLAAFELDADRSAADRQAIGEQQQKVLSDTAYARRYFEQCGNGERAAVLGYLEEEYTTPTLPLRRAVELADRGERAYAVQLLARATAINPDYTGLATVRQYLDLP